MAAEGYSAESETQSRIAREAEALERQIDEVRILRTVYHDHLLGLLSYRLSQRLQALERLGQGDGVRALATLDLRPLRPGYSITSGSLAAGPPVR
jgi:hypothetical protein